MKEYTVIFERGPKSWGAYFPDLPGCVAVAKTRDAVEKLIREAIEMYVEDMLNRGVQIPAPTSEAGIVAVSS